VSIAVSPRPTLENLSERFAPVLAEIAAGAVQRERERVLPHEQVRLLAAEGFTRITVPQEFGGDGVNLHDLFALLIQLGTADSNLPQLLRAHFAFVEELLLDGDDEQQRRWFPLIVEGQVFGNATHERTSAKVGEFVTRLTPDGDDWLLQGRKFYSTGTIFADWTTVAAVLPDGGRARAVVRVDDPGVDAQDDWAGFGQRLTGSGTTVLDAVKVPAAHVHVGRASRQTPLAGFVELVLLATLAGVARAAERDAATFVRNRSRHYSQGVGTTAQNDPLVQTVVGKVSADAVAAEALVLHAASVLDLAHDAVVAGSDDVAARVDAAELATVQVQLTVVELVLRATTALFEVGGASATNTSLALDRHWRNARVLSSHNPVVFQQRVIGDHLVNGSPLTYFWDTGETREGDDPAS
jgi:alkylation response protein AidB-like acyl-CoA dehydrogenase